MADHVTAINADVVWHADTGKAERDVEALRRQFHEATQSMSTQALRAASAQEKLDRALIKHGSTSRQARDAEVALRKVMAETTVQAEKESAALQRTERDVGRLGRGALVGSGRLHGLARSVAFASTSFLGGFGLVYALRQAIGAASTLQEETEKTGVVFGDSAGEVQSWSRTLALSFGVSEQQALKAAGVFGNMFHSLHIGEQDAATMSKRLVELAADMASFNNASPEETLQALSSGLAGQVRPLRQYGVFLSQDRIAQEALADGISKTGKHLDATQKLQASYNIILKDTAIQQGDVARNSESLSVSQSKANAELQQSEAIIGSALRPQLAHLANNVAEYLDNANKSGQLQREVNHLFREGSKVAHGLAEGFDAIRTVGEPLVHTLGGVEQTAKLMLEAFAVYKLAKIATGIRGIGKAWGFVADEATAAAGAETAAAGAGVGGAAAGARVPGYIGLPGGALGGAIAGAALALAQRGESSVHVGGQLDVSVGPGDVVSYRDPVTGKYILLSGFHGKSKKSLEAFLRADIAKRHPELVPPEVSGEDVAQRGAAARQETAKPGAGDGGHHTGRKHGFSLTYALQLQEAKAAAGQGSVIGAAQDELRYVKAQLAGGKLNKQGVLDALAEQSRLEDQIDGILQGRKDRAAEAERKRAAAHRKELAEEKRRKHEAERRVKERERARRERIRTDLGIEERKLTNQLLKAQLTTTLTDDRAAYEAEIAFYRKEEHDRRLTRQEREGYVTKELRARKDEAALGKRLKGASNIDFFSEAAANFRTYGGNTGDVLSGQDARGLLARIALTLEKTERHTKSTAKTNHQLVKNGPHPAKTAAALADVGAWTQ